MDIQQAFKMSFKSLMASKLRSILTMLGIIIGVAAVIVIVGLGLIGGSMARALRGFEDFDVVGVDVSQPTLRYAWSRGWWTGRRRTA